MNVYNKTAEDLSPTGGEWRLFKSRDVGINNSFSGAGGNQTTTPERTFPSDGEVRIYVVDNRVTHIEIPELGWTFRSESMHGTPIRGGINSTNDWFTFGINSFKLMDPYGLVHKNSPNIRDKDFMQCRNTIRTGSRNQQLHHGQPERERPPAQRNHYSQPQPTYLGASDKEHSSQQDHRSEHKECQLPYKAP